MSDNEDIPAETPLSPEEAILRRHRREKKELQGKIVALKKNITKNDKKKKKELADEVAKLEAELELRHKAELDTFRPQRVELVPMGEDPKPPVEDNTEPVNGTDEEDHKRGKQSKARKRREKKAAQEKERQLRVDQETAELLEGADWKVEDEKLVELLNEMNLQVHDIMSDGHWAISHQLEQYGDDVSVEHLRGKTAEYLLEHKDEFINYLDELETNVDGEYEKYCKEVAETAAWGGQVELRALSQILKRPIRVIQADGPPILLGEDFHKETLHLTYHKHKFKLGAHYNSVVPVTKSNV